MNLASRPSVRWVARSWWVCIAALALAGCDGRSVGVSDPDNTNDPDGGGRRDGTAWPGRDSSFPPGPDGTVVTCVDSPLQGIWLGTFDGTVTAPDIGSIPVSGTVRLEVYCEFDLYVSGELTGSESGGVPFRMDVTGRYDEDVDFMESTFSGHVDQYPAYGNLTGGLQSGFPQRLSGDWDVWVDAWQMTGDGHWSATLQ